MSAPFRKPATPRSFAAATAGWALLSGIGLVVGGTEGGLIVGVASQILVLYGLWRLQAQRRNGNGGNAEHSVEAAMLEDDIAAEESGA